MLIRPDDAWKKMREGDAFVVDIRTPEEHAQQKIEGTHVNADWFAFAEEMTKIEEKLAAGEELIVYCRSGARSAQCVGFLRNQGYENVYDLAGGIIGWAQNGLPVE